MTLGKLYLSSVSSSVKGGWPRRPKALSSPNTLDAIFGALKEGQSALANTSVLNLDCTMQLLEEALKNTDFYPRDSDFIGLGHDLSIWFFKGSLGDSMCILRLKATKAYIMVMG